MTSFELAVINLPSAGEGQEEASIPNCCGWQKSCMTSLKKSWRNTHICIYVYIAMSSCRNVTIESSKCAVVLGIETRQCAVGKTVGCQELPGVGVQNASI